MATQVLSTLADLRPGDHLCLLYANEDEHRAIVTPFIRDGLERNERVIYIANAHDGATILQYLRDAGVPVEAHGARDQFRLLTAPDAYLRDRVFDPAKMIALLEAETRAALDAGYTALRVTGEMTWALQGSPGSDRLIEYETQLNQFFPTHACLAICQYDRRRFSAELLLDVLRTHPLAIIGTTIHANPFFVPPDELAQPNPAQVTLEHWLANLESRHRLERALHETNAALEQRVAERTRELEAEIAQREQIAKELRASETTARALLDAILESALLIEEDGVIVDINTIGAQRLGKTRAELIGANAYDFLPAEVAAARRPKVALALQTNEPVVFEDTRNGIVFHQSINAVPATAPGKRRLAIFGQDITERKRAEQQLAEAKEYFELVFNLSPDAAQVTRLRDGCIININQGVTDMTGYTREDMLGKRTLEVDLWDDPQDRENVIRALKEKGHCNNYEVTFKRKDGSRLVCILSSRLYIYHGEPHVITLTRDITTRKRAERILEQSEERYRGLFNAIKGVIKK